MANNSQCAKVAMVPIQAVCTQTPACINSQSGGFSHTANAATAIWDMFLLFTVAITKRLTHTDTHAQTHTHTNTPTQHTQTHRHTHTHTHTHTRTQTHTHMHTLTHTHTPNAHTHTPNILPATHSLK